MITYYLEDDNGLLVPHELTLPYFINTEEFCRDANYFLLHGRYPCGEEGTEEYDNWWDEQERRCILGYTVGGVRITGDHYFYLNFCQIKLTEDDDKEVLGKRRAGTKILSFPKFYDGDYLYFHLKEIARKAGKHLCVGKARRKGYSFKNAAIAAKRYKMFADSSTVFIAYDSKYLFAKGKGIMVMTSDYIDFINKNTAWSRTKLIDQKDWKKDGFIDKVNGVNIESGFKSEVMAITAGSNPDVARGKDGALVVFEEAGKFSNLDATMEATMPIVEDGVYVTGQIIVFGTGGGEDNNWEHFENIFYNPEAHNFLPIKNIWDDDIGDSKCGFFHPDYLNKTGYIDKNGNSFTEEAKAFELEARKKKEKHSRSPLDVIQYKMERPFSPKEAFARSNHNIFPVEMLDAALKRIENSNFDYKLGVTVDLVRENGFLKSRMNNKIPVTSFPLKGDLSGTVVIYSPPVKIHGVIPDNLYFLCHDPYATDTSQGPSVGATYVIMNPNNITANKGDMIVASWVGRPETLDEYNRILFDLAEYYNAKIGFENDRGDVVSYAKRFKKLHWLIEEFELGWDDKIKRSITNGKFGMHIGSGKDDLRRKIGDKYIADWLILPRTVSENGKNTLNLDAIPDRGLLKELIRYKPGLNTDRVSALRIGMYYFREQQYKGTGTDFKRKTDIITKRLLNKIIDVS